VTSGADYGWAYYEHVDDWAAPSAAAVVPMLIEIFGPTSVVDVGCGPGTWAAAFIERGLDDVRGVDGGDVDLAQLRIPESRFVRHDLTEPLDLGRRFDLALCLEVADALPDAAAPGLIASLARLAPAVAFSAAIPHQGGKNHVNEQWPAYWASLFADHGFAAVDCLRAKLWRDESVAWWYAQNLVLYVAAEALESAPELTPEPGSPIALVHPTRYVEWVEWGTAVARGDYD
jgi:SAM-dependent methyltransferase